jgi:hypothetical protein
MKSKHRNLLMWNLLMWLTQCPAEHGTTSGKPCVYFSCFFYLPQVEKVPIPESTTYVEKEIPSTF